MVAWLRPQTKAERQTGKSVNDDFQDNGSEHQIAILKKWHTPNLMQH
jgi:hypothetical protein